MNLKLTNYENYLTTLELGVNIVKKPNRSIKYYTKSHH